ncbi:cellulase family glycosylhydrolase [Sandaracinus amylolyticus]|uniref:cellulase family glycosylhydrolase n=1 Tax=Sandaracinus amylolyticus TaxID=927083 RepID=UPI001F451075|nr:cellulase family glycosylhydrolase [Sandaracinus amylolyticus]UJR78297.1 Endoglycoceramidase II [Sandaracinus amylolyticus]
MDRRFVLAGLALSLISCGDDPAPIVLEPWDPPEQPWVRSDRTRFRDDADRVLVFRGINARVEGLFDVTFDDGRLPLEEIPAFTIDDARRMRALGLNALRLPINWSGIEPVQGEYSEAYLERLEEVVELCRQAGVHVMIDFHQDAYSKEIGEDGAPLWAIHPPPDELLGGPLGDLEARRTSEQVLRAFEGFFDTRDEDTTDVMLQAAYFAMARHVAERFADDPWVLGYDLYNEPIADDRLLADFHARMAAELREVDDRHVMFFEPNSVRNLTEMGPRASAPFPDDGGAYAVHLYTLAFRDPRNELDTVTLERLRPNVERGLMEASLFGVPMFVGEWGIRPDSPGSDDYVRFMHELFDETFTSATVWLWKENSQGSWGFHDYDPEGGAFTERDAVVRAHARVYAEAVAGEPMSMRYDLDARRFELVYEGRADDAPSVVYVPDASYFASSFAVRCDGRAIEPTPARDAATGRVEIVCGGPGRRTVVLEATE